MTYRLAVLAGHGTGTEVMVQARRVLDAVASRDGLDFIYDEQLVGGAAIDGAGKPLPDFTGTAAHEVRLKLDGQVTDPKFVRFLERLGEEKLRSFSTYDFLALDAIARDRTLTEALRSLVSGLIDSGGDRIARPGTPHPLSLVPTPLRGSRERGAYTRKRGLDHETNKALLLKHLRDNAEVGSPLVELCQVLPSLSRASVQRLLGDLRQEDKARLDGCAAGAGGFHARLCLNPRIQINLKTSHEL